MIVETIRAAHEMSRIVIVQGQVSAGRIEELDGFHIRDGDPGEIEASSHEHEGIAAGAAVIGLESRQSCAVHHEAVVAGRAAQNLEIGQGRGRTQVEEAGGDHLDGVRAGAAVEKVPGRQAARSGLQDLVRACPDGGIRGGAEEFGRCVAGLVNGMVDPVCSDGGDHPASVIEGGRRLPEPIMRGRNGRAPVEWGAILVQ